MQLTATETVALIERLRSLNVVAWELVALVPAKGNSPFINVIEAIVNETDALVAPFDRNAGEQE